MTAWQCALPLDEHTERAWNVLVGGNANASVRVELRHCGARVEVLFRRFTKGGGRAPRARHWVLDLTVAPPFDLRAPWENRRLTQFLEALDADGRWEAKRRLDHNFREALRWLPTGRGELPAGRRAAIQPVTTALAQVQAHLRARSVPHALRVAAMFPVRGAARPFAYMLAASDPSGRIAQLAGLCPGVILLLAGLHSRGRYAAGERAIESITSGQRLPRVLDACIEAWAEAWTAAGSPPSATRLRAQRTRMARAGVQVSPDVLWEPVDFIVPPEDIPVGASENAAWFAAVEAFSTGTHRIRDVRQRNGTLLFFSKHYRAVAPWARQSMFPGWLADYVVGAWRFPGRSTDPRRLMDECATWHLHRSWEVDMDLATPLPRGAYAGPDTWTDGVNTLTRMTKVSDLVQESASMQHCIASYAEDAVAGHFDAFRGELCGERVTVGLHVDPSTGKHTTVEAVRFKNAKLTAAQSVVLSAWLAKIWTGDDEEEDTDPDAEELAELFG